LIAGNEVHKKGRSLLRTPKPRRDFGPMLRLVSAGAYRRPHSAPAGRHGVLPSGTDGVLPFETLPAAGSSIAADPLRDRPDLAPALPGVTFPQGCGQLSDAEILVRSAARPAERGTGADDTVAKFVRAVLTMWRPVSG
jgi:hypothetical protein